MRKKQRTLWVSLALVGMLALGSVALFATGTRPVLGLDLEGGVSVILSAPDGTPETVMNQALENIRNRIDAFGTAEPLLFVTGNTIEVQIPGLARGTVDERPKVQFCIADDESNTYTCFDERDAAEELHVERRRQADPAGARQPCEPHEDPEDEPQHDRRNRQAQRAPREAAQPEEALDDQEREVGGDDAEVEHAQPPRVMRPGIAKRRSTCAMTDAIPTQRTR